MEWPPFLDPLPDGARLRLKVQPRASRNEVLAERSQPELRVRVTAPPVDSAANAAVLELLAETLGCRRGAVQLLRGQTSRQKVVAISGMSAAQIVTRLGLTPDAGAARKP